MVLLHNIIQILALTETNPTGKNTFFLQRFRGSRIGRVLVHVDHPGHAIAGRAQGLAEEAFGPRRVPFGREQEFNGLAGRVHCAIQVFVFALNLYIGLVRAVAICSSASDVGGSVC